MQQELSSSVIQSYAQRFASDPSSKTRMNAIVKSGIEAVAADWESQRRMRYDFSVEVETGEITNQKASGRCWMFAALNMMRMEVMKKCELETFELSQNYPLFWDKLERANYFLETILDTLDEPLEGRLMHFLLQNPLEDGGQWDMFSNLIKKYGAVPKAWMPETYHSSNTGMMNRMLRLKLRIHAATLRENKESGCDLESLRNMKENAMYEMYQILVECLGVPPKEIVFEYRVKPKKEDIKEPMQETKSGAVKSQFFRDEPLSPVQFYEKYIGLNLDEYINLINVPSADKPFDKTFIVANLGNVWEGAPVKYLNVEMSVMKQAIIAQLQDGLPVWFGCDISQMLNQEWGVMDMGGFDYQAALGSAFDFSKAHRLAYGDSLLTHAMLFVGVNLDETGVPNRWKVENSWGEKTGNKGWYIMDDKWFDLFTYQAVIHRKYLCVSVLANWSQNPIVLKPWDPMGTLAKMR